MRTGYGAGPSHTLTYKHREEDAQILRRLTVLLDKNKTEVIKQAVRLLAAMHGKTVTVQDDKGEIQKLLII